MGNDQRYLRMIHVSVTRQPSSVGLIDSAARPRGHNVVTNATPQDRIRQDGLGCLVAESGHLAGQEQLQHNQTSRAPRGSIPPSSTKGAVYHGKCGSWAE